HLSLSLPAVLVVPDAAKRGVLGNLRYRAVPMEENDLFQVTEDSNPPSKTTSSRHDLLMVMGNNSLKIDKGSWTLKGWLLPSSSEQNDLFVVLSLTHALSDGPGALRKDDAYDDLKPFQTAFAASTAGEKDSSSTETRIFPPESMQHLPTGPVDDCSTGSIRAIHIELDADLTTQLVQSCRSVGATVQGVISAAAAVARIKALLLAGAMNNEATSPILCAIQVPVNTRSFVKDDTNIATACLCDSAGIVHPLQVDLAKLGPSSVHAAMNEIADNEAKGAAVTESELKIMEDLALYLLELTKDCSQQVKTTIQRNQPLEWLRRLMNDPASMPPYSLMASSIGVSPVQANYRGVVKVKECLFFGASLQTAREAQATMVHVVTFDGRMQLMMNFTYPGIQMKPFMESVANEMEALLRLVAYKGDCK
ncbi:MAG: hypothetical protein SGILL_008934, partial [Bacillariaceae sp.]